MNILFASICMLQFYVSHTQKVAPGVPPQHYQQYQQAPPPQQQQYAPQYQQPPPPQQQVPMQQQQVPVQQQQPQGHSHGHGHGHGHSGQPQVLNAANVQQEAAHIAEHMEVPIDTSKMSDQELQFHYFKMHDADNNNKLDGCELIKSLIHWHEQGSKDKPGTVDEKIFKDEELTNLIDPILNVDDHNRDGFIDYPEFVRAQQKAAAAHQQQQQGGRQ